MEGTDKSTELWRHPYYGYFMGNIGQNWSKTFSSGHTVEKTLHKVQTLDTSSSQELISPQKSHLYKTTLLGFHLIGINFNSGNEYWFRQRDCQPCRWGVSCDGGPLIRYEPVEGDFRGVDVRRFIFVRGAEAAEKARGLVGH